jgi:hypothetical protein
MAKPVTKMISANPLPGADKSRATEVGQSMKDNDELNDTRISLYVPHSMAGAVKKAAKGIPISMNDYCRIALRAQLKSDGVAMDAA